MLNAFQMFLSATIFYHVLSINMEQKIQIFDRHWTKMYPMALMCLFPLSGEYLASFPQVLELSWRPPVPKPTLESQLPQSFPLLPRIPILALDAKYGSQTALNPSLLQWNCKEACEPTSDFHVLRPSEVARYFPSAINEYRELACLLMTMNLVCLPILMPRQILEKRVLQ